MYLGFPSRTRFGKSHFSVSIAEGLGINHITPVDREASQYNVHVPNTEITTSALILIDNLPSRVGQFEALSIDKCSPTR